MPQVICILTFIFGWGITLDPRLDFLGPIHYFFGFGIAAGALAHAELYHTYFFEIDDHITHYIIKKIGLSEMQVLIIQLFFWIIIAMIIYIFQGDEIIACYRDSICQK